MSSFPSFSGVLIHSVCLAGCGRCFLSFKEMNNIHPLHWCSWGDHSVYFWCLGWQHCDKSTCMLPKCVCLFLEHSMHTVKGERAGRETVYTVQSVQNQTTRTPESIKRNATSVWTWDFFPYSKCNAWQWCTICNMLHLNSYASDVIVGFICISSNKWLFWFKTTWILFSCVCVCR